MRYSPKTRLGLRWISSRTEQSGRLVTLPTYFDVTPHFFRKPTIVSMCNNYQVVGVTVTKACLKCYAPFGLSEIACYNHYVELHITSTKSRFSTHSRVHTFGLNSAEVLDLQQCAGYSITVPHSTEANIAQAAGLLLQTGQSSPAS